MRLGGYLVRRLAVSFGMIAAVFLGMLLLFETVEMMRRFGGGETSAGQIFLLSALKVPSTFYQILPLIMILASMTLFLGLARSSELVVIRAAGRSAVRMMLEPAVATLVFGALMVTVLNPLVASSNRLYQARLAEIRDPNRFTQISLEGSAIWMRQGDQHGQTVIRAQGVNPETLEFSAVMLMQFDRETGFPLERIEADRARLDEGRWILSAAKRWNLQDTNPEQTALSYDTLELASDLSDEQISDSFARPGMLSFWDMPAFITALERAGLSTRTHWMQLHAELAMPLLMVAMLLVGAVLNFRHTRAGGTGTRILVTVLAGFALFFVRNFAQVLGENGQIPLLLAVWTPPLASMLLALGIFLHLEDG